MLGSGMVGGVLTGVWGIAGNAGAKPAQFCPFSCVDRRLFVYTMPMICLAGYFRDEPLFPRFAAGAQDCYARSQPPP